MRLIDADAYAAEMKTRQDACKEMMDAAIATDNWEMYDGLSRAYSIFTEASLTLRNTQTIDAVPVPCYVGEEIWYVPEWNKKPFKAVCHCISIDKGGVRVHLYDMDGDNATYPARLVFKTKEDAEKYILKGENRC